MSHQHYESFLGFGTLLILGISGIAQAQPSAINSCPSPHYSIASPITYTVGAVADSLFGMHMNASGEVAATSLYTPQPLRVTPHGSVLNILPPNVQSQGFGFPEAINNNGVIAGSFRKSATGPLHAFVQYPWSDFLTDIHEYLLPQAHQGQSNSAIIDINDGGYTLGMFSGSSGVTSYFIHGYLNGVQDVKPSTFVPFRITEDKKLLGGMLSGSTFQAALWDDGRLQTAGFGAGLESSALDINATGLIVGRAKYLDNKSHGFIYDSTKQEIKLYPPGISESATVRSINDAGWKLVTYPILPFSQYMFVEIDGKFHQLAGIIDADSPVPWDVRKLTNTGDIIGTVFSAGKQVPALFKLSCKP